MPKKIILAGGLTALIISVLLVLIMINSRQQEQIAELPPTTTETRIIPYEEETVEDYNLFTDNDAVMIQVGINGVIEDIYELTYDKSGNIIDKKLIESIETSKVQNRIIQQGMLDRIETTERIRTRLSEYIEHLKKSDIPAAFPYIQQTDRQLFSQQTLQDNATALNWQIESHAINADLEFIYPDYLTVFDDSLTGSQTTGDSSAIDLPKGKESLRANIPLGIIFQSDVIGRQAVELKLSCTKENDDWFFSYIGPTEITDIDRSEYRDDGGRTYGNTVGARLTLNKAIIFTNFDHIFFSYLLENTSNPNYEDELENEPIIVNAQIMNASIFDDPNTGYALLDKTLFQQAYDDVYIGQSAVGRLVFSPAPGQNIEKVYLSTIITVGDYQTTMDFGEIILNRQFRQLRPNSSSTEEIIDNEIIDTQETENTVN